MLVFLMTDILPDLGHILPELGQQIDTKFSLRLVPQLAPQVLALDN